MTLSTSVAEGSRCNGGRTTSAHTRVFHHDTDGVYEGFDLVEDLVIARSRGRGVQGPLRWAAHQTPRGGFALQRCSVLPDLDR